MIAEDPTLSDSQAGRWWPSSLPFFILLAGVSVLLGLIQLREPPAIAEHIDAPPLVQLATVETCERGLEFAVDGEVVPVRQISLAAEVGGRIIEKSAECRAGQFVARDTLLMSIDPRDYDLEIRRLQEAVKEAGVNIEEVDVEAANTETLIELAESQLKINQTELNRYESLSRRQAAAAVELDAARRSELQARNSLQLLRNQQRLIATRRSQLVNKKEQLLAQLDKATLDRGRTEIRAPIDGVIVEDAVEKGDLVQPGSLLLRIEDTSRVEVRFDLTMDQLRWLWPNGKAADQPQSYQLAQVPVRVELALRGRHYQWRGQLTRYDGAGINAATRTVPCIAVVDHPRSAQPVSGPPDAALAGPPTLMRGMFVSVHIEVPALLSLLEIPVAALRPGDRVWVVDDQQRLNVAPVNLIQMRDQTAVLLAEGTELAPGDRVVVSPLTLAVGGMQVRTAASSQPSGDSPRQQVMAETNAWSEPRGPSVETSR